jgi:Arc/MetJ-type ribon-helix-helix transcriptional regulator
MLERIDGYKSGRFATRSEAVRAILREALNGEGRGCEPASSVGASR